MAEEVEKVAAQEELIKVKVEDKQTDIPSLYVNNAQFSHTEWDLRVDLGELHSVDTEAKTMFVIPRIRLIMTPTFAARFLEVLGDTLQRRLVAAQSAQAKPTEESKK